MDSTLPETQRGERRRADDTPLCWVLRDDMRLTGTNSGCGIAQCGACTVELNGMTRRSCVTPISMSRVLRATNRAGRGREDDAPYRPQGKRSTCPLAVGVNPDRSERHGPCCADPNQDEDIDMRNGEYLPLAPPMFVSPPRSRRRPKAERGFKP